MAKLVTQYSVLISCPGDVQEELEIIKQVIDDFNKTIGEANNVNLTIKHWATHSYPQSGGRPQELLNKQIVLDSDAAIAVFWTRFGTPTEEYGSGTEEEIELLIKENKQVFLYFSKKDISPYEINSEQFHKIKRFKEKYKNKGIYWEYSNIEEFRSILTNHVNMHFLNVITEKDQMSSHVDIPKLTIKGIYSNDIIDTPRILQFKLGNSQFIKEIIHEIKATFENISSIELPIDVDKEEKESIDKSVNNIGSFVKVDIPKIELNLSDMINKRIKLLEEDIDLVVHYANEKEISIDEDTFFNLGNLVKTKNFISSPIYGGSTYTLNGTDVEKEKYRLIKNLILKIKQYNEWLEYFKEIDSKYVIQLAVSNNGRTYDEDVDIKLYIKKGYLLKNNELPLPGTNIIESATEDLEYLYKIKQTYNIEEYFSFETNEISINSDMMIPGITYKKSIEDLIDNFRYQINDIFIYEYYQNDEFDIISFKIPYIKQHKNISFPTKLLFRSKINKIIYEINSKHSPEVIKRTLEIDEF